MPVRLVTAAVIAQDHQRLLPGVKRLDEALLGRLSGRGFKLLLDLFASADRPIAFRELPFAFRRRAAGTSKLGLGVAWDFVHLLGRKRLAHRRQP